MAREETSAEEEQAQAMSVETGSSTAPARREPEKQGGRPRDLLRRVSRDLDRAFGVFGTGLFGSLAPSWFGEMTRWPEIEVFQRGNRLVVRADVPGLKEDDVNVEVRGKDLYIFGERRSETERTEGGIYRSERSYGSFTRVIPLPEGAKSETASATFENGVLEIEVEIPKLETRGTRRIEVRGKATH
jgi:HSP20 family protein